MEERKEKDRKALAIGGGWSPNDKGRIEYGFPGGTVSIRVRPVELLDMGLDLLLWVRVSVNELMGFDFCLYN